MRILTCSMLAGLMVLSLHAQASVTALVGATLHPIDQPPIDNGTLLIRNGQIEAIGVDLTLPADASVVRLDGQHVYPGFIHPASSLGLIEVASVAGTVDTTEMNPINPAIRADVAFNHDS
ncbi:MAG: amidohydrolase, partial [Pseudomonadota bacterium]